jgi:hypothetical protein
MTGDPGYLVAVLSCHPSRRAPTRSAWTIPGVELRRASASGRAKHGFHGEKKRSGMTRWWFLYVFIWLLYGYFIWLLYGYYDMVIIWLIIIWWVVFRHPSEKWWSEVVSWDGYSMPNINMETHKNLSVPKHQHHQPVIYIWVWINTY